MKVVEKDHLVSGVKVGTYLTYSDVEPEYNATEPRTRVLPAPYFYEKRLFFYLINRFEPGQNKFFPNGGFEVRDEGGAVRCFDMDQVIIHPAVLKHAKQLDRLRKRAEKAHKQRGRKRKQLDETPVVRSGHRGRPALDPAEKARREQEKVTRAARSGGKRGRPASDKPKAPVNLESKPAGRRGRPALSPEARAAQSKEKDARRQKSGGKRGRPKRK
jgi:hypothetical protein